MSDEKNVFYNKSVLITGGTGSFGRCMAKRLIRENHCRRVIIFSRDEWKQWEMQQSDPDFSDPKMRFFLGDVRDASRLERAFHDVQIVVHAAALKQVPAAEYNPSEFVKTNVLGAMNVIDAAIGSGVERVIALSTDKAVNPINLYGATKLCSDKLFVAGKSYVGAKGFPFFSVVRYGNVLGSRGSIIPLWQEMIKNGASNLPVTDERMTRFWITLDEAVDFVFKNFERMRGGEIFVPKIPSMKITDLANAIAPGLPLKQIGIRPGEKLHEVMIGTEDGRHTVEYNDHYVIIPETISSNKELLSRFLSGRPAPNTPEDFVFASNTNSAWLTSADLKKLFSSN